MDGAAQSLMTLCPPAWHDGYALPKSLATDYVLVTAVTASGRRTVYDGAAMNGTTPIEILEGEHRVIEKVAAGMPGMADTIDAGQEPDIPVLEGTIEFLRSFADRRHHGKEEQLLFPALARRGVPAQGCPIGGLTKEHEKGRAMVAEFADAIAAYETGEPSAKPRLSASLRALADFYTNHIWKEDQLLFPLALRLLTPEDNAELARDFKAADATLVH